MTEMTTQEIGKSEKLLLAVVQAQDCDIAVDILEAESFTVTRLPSVGGFLGKRNATLMVCASHSDVPKVKALLENTCRKRIAFIAVPAENTPLPMPMPTPVTVGGVSLFSIDIEHHEEV